MKISAIAHPLEGCQRLHSISPRRCERSESDFVLEGVTFKTASATLSKEGTEKVNELAVLLKGHPGAKIKVVGHTDNAGNPEVNRVLSQDRAAAVRDELIRQGITPDRNRNRRSRIGRSGREERFTHQHEKNRRIDVIRDIAVGFLSARLGGMSRSLSLPLRNFVFLVSGLAAACSGRRRARHRGPAAADAANTDGTQADGDANGSSSDDASVTADVGDSSSASETPDASVTADAGPSADAEAGALDGAPDVSSPNDSGDAASDAAEEASSESGSDSATDALEETPLDGASDAPLDVDVSSGTVLLLGGGASTVFTGEFHPGSPWIRIDLAR